MFDDRLFDVIMGEMMSTFGTDVRTDEGSLAYNACAKIAEKLEEIYGDMDEINSNILPDTQDDSHLIMYGRERGVDYQYATYPIVRGTFQQEIEIGERFVCNDYTYEVIELISGFEYRLQCETEGAAANANFGLLEPVDYVDEYLGGNIIEIIEPGVDDENIEEYRQKVIDTYKSTAFGGNKADYRQFVNKIEGVGGCKPKRRTAESPWIEIVIIDSEYDLPSSLLVEQVQSLVDPEQNSGEGDGMAPICHNVSIIPVAAGEVNVNVQITFDTGYSSATSQSVIEAVIEGYLQELRKEWESKELGEIVVRISQIETKVLSIEGVLDVSNTTINGSTDNLVLDYTKIPVLGGVTIV